MKTARALQPGRFKTDSEYDNSVVPDCHGFAATVGSLQYVSELAQLDVLDVLQSELVVLVLF